MHVIPAFSFFAGDEACTRRSSSSSSSSRPRIAAPADRSTASAVLAARGVTAGLLAEAGSCLVSISFAGAEAKAIGSELLRRHRGRATQARQSADVCLSLSLFRAHATKCCKKVQNTEKNRTQWYAILGEVLGTKDQSIDQRTNDKMFGP